MALVPRGGGAATTTAMAALAAGLLLSSCGGGDSRGTVLGVPTSSPAAPASCIDVQAARAIWTSVRDRLAAVQRDPHHSGLLDVTTGRAAAQTDQYLRDALIAHNVTEREEDRLDSLRVLSGACTPAEPLILEVRDTLVRDDYLKPDGRLDHVDPNVGRQMHNREAYRRIDSVWKLSDLEDLDAPPPTLPPGMV